MFGMLYESDHTKWMREQLAQHPEWVADQKVGRALWWDKQPQALDQQARTAASGEAQKPYPYDNNFAQR